jgi:hypothetical protein
MSSLLQRPAVTVVAGLAFVVGCAVSLAAQPRPSRTDTSRAVSITYADGRSVTSPLRHGGGMWTGEFPRMPGVQTSRDGQLLSTLDVKHGIEGDDVVLTVSLSYGGPGRNAVTVARVRLSGEEAVQVTELRAYGVEPILVSLVPIPPSTAYAPTAVSASAQLFVRAEPVGSNTSAYRVLLANESLLPLMWLQYKAYRGDRLAIMGRPRGKRNLPLVLPGAEYSFDITTSTAALDSPDRPEPWQAIDRIEVTSVMWQDGTLEGDPQPAAEQRRFDQLRARQLVALREILRGGTPQSMASLREQIASGLTSDLEVRRARDSMLGDLDALVSAGKAPDSPEFRAWVARTLGECEQWLMRIAQSKG